MTVVDPIRDERGWAFRNGPAIRLDPLNGFQFLAEAYRATDPGYRGRVTVPVLWDTVTNRIVTNSDDDLMRIFNGAFNQFTDSTFDLYPAALRQEIDASNTFIYETINNGVYRAGFATSQQAYEHAARRLFEGLDQLEIRLRDRGIFSDHSSSSPTGGCLSRCFGSMPSIMAISNATSGASSITHISPGISRTCTRWQALPRRSISTISNGTITSRITTSTRLASSPSGRSWISPARMDGSALLTAPPSRLLNMVVQQGRKGRRE